MAELLPLPPNPFVIYFSQRFIFRVSDLLSPARETTAKGQSRVINPFLAADSICRISKPPASSRQVTEYSIDRAIFREGIAGDFVGYKVIVLYSARSCDSNDTDIILG